MRTVREEPVLIRVVVACAFLLLLAPLTPRTTWVSPEPRDSGGTAGVRHSAGWDWVAPACGLVVIVGVMAGRRLRPRGARAVAGTVVALIAFAVAAVAAGGHWRDAASGDLDMRGFATQPAPAALPVAIVALVGAGCALSLAVAWVKTGDGGT